MRPCRGSAPALLILVNEPRFVFEGRFKVFLGIPSVYVASVWVGRYLADPLEPFVDSRMAV